MLRALAPERRRPAQHGLTRATAEPGRIAALRRVWRAPRRHRPDRQRRTRRKMWPVAETSIVFPDLSLMAQVEAPLNELSLPNLQSSGSNRRSTTPANKSPSTSPPRATRTSQSRSRWSATRSSTPSASRPRRRTSSTARRSRGTPPDSRREEAVVAAGGGVAYRGGIACRLGRSASGRRERLVSARRLRHPAQRVVEGA